MDGVRARAADGGKGTLGSTAFNKPQNGSIKEVYTWACNFISQLFYYYFGSSFFEST